MEELYNQLKLERTGKLKNNVLLVKKTNSKDDKTYCLKMPTPEQEIKLYRDCFPKVNQNEFNKLKLPNAIKVGSLFANYGWWVLMEYYGDDYILWDEESVDNGGGKSVTIDHVDTLIDMISDLKTIDIKLFENVIPTVDKCPWYTSILKKAEGFMNRGLLTVDDFNKITNLLSSGLTEEQKKDYIVTNGDFQFRNFIKQPDGKVAVIDWTENAHNTPNIEPIEFPIMYQWTLMWSNQTWQNEYARRTMKAFNISHERLASALVVKSINQASIWPNSQLEQIQIQHCIRGLNGHIITSNVVT